MEAIDFPRIVEPPSISPSRRHPLVHHKARSSSFFKSSSVLNLAIKVFLSSVSSPL